MSHLSIGMSFRHPQETIGTNGTQNCGRSHRRRPRRWASADPRTVRSYRADSPRIGGQNTEPLDKIRHQEFVRRTARPSPAVCPPLFPKLHTEPGHFCNSFRFCTADRPPVNTGRSEVHFWQPLKAGALLELFPNFAGKPSAPYRRPIRRYILHSPVSLFVLIHRHVWSWKIHIKLNITRIDVKQILLVL
jgi:hypothetical protein